MSISDLHDDPEYVSVFLGLIEREAESTRLDAAELREGGFVPVQVRGSSSVVWERSGVYFTTEAALAEIRPTIEDKEE